MKNVILLFLLTISTLQAAASNREESALKIRFNDNRPITVSIDGRNYDRYGKSLTFGNLPSGWHNLKVYEFIEYQKGGGRAKLMYSGSVRIKSGVVVYCIVDAATRRMRVRTQDIDDLYVDYDKANSIDEDAPRNHDDTRSERVNRSKDAVALNDIIELERIIKNKITDTDKLKLLKTALKEEKYYLSDVRNILGWLSFESSRLDFVKWSYSRVLDAKDYWKLDSDFNFSSSKNELHKFIKKQQR